MKTIHLKITVILLLFFSFTTTITAQNNLNYKTISGIVKDKKTKNTIAYANVSIDGTNLSTVTNNDGEFSIKYGESVDAKRINTSRIGYINQQIVIEDTSQYLEILLDNNVHELNEIVVELVDPLKLVELALRKIGDNYSKEPTLLKGFYRETAQKRNDYMTISEAVVNIYRTPYTQDIQQDRIQIYKGRSLLSPKLSDTIVVKLQGGPNMAKHLDIVKNKDLILDLETIDFYKYTLGESLTLNNRLHYVVNFTPQVTVPIALYEGTLYIDEKTLTISRAQFNLDMSNKTKATEMIVAKKPSKMRFQASSLETLVTYTEKDGISYLNYVRNEIKFKCNWKQLFYIFAPTYTITSELVVTDKKNADKDKISFREAFGERDKLLDKIDKFYDPDFWEDFTIIEPTESLDAAVDKIRKLQK